MPLLFFVYHVGRVGKVYTTQSANMGVGGHSFKGEAALHQLTSFDETVMESLGAFEADVIVLADMDDEVNARLARRAKELTDGRVLVRIEQPKLQLEFSREGFEVFSTLFAARTVLRALIENPGGLQLIAESEGTIHEVTVVSLRLHMVLLRQLPLLDQLLILRIYRGESFLIPHGNTEIRRGGRLS